MLPQCFRCCYEEGYSEGLVETPVWWSQSTAAATTAGLPCKLLAPYWTEEWKPQPLQEDEMCGESPWCLPGREGWGGRGGRRSAAKCREWPATGRVASISFYSCEEISNISKQWVKVGKIMCLNKKTGSWDFSPSLEPFFSSLTIGRAVQVSKAEAGNVCVPIQSTVNTQNFK